jgi:molybdate transport system substrate-binding protein
VYLTLLRFMVAAALAMVGCLTSTVSAQPVIAAASDLKFALEEVAARYRQETGTSVRLVFGSSGNLSTQILNGAPFDVFLSADESLTKKIHFAGLSDDAGQVFGRGRLVLYLPKGSQVKADSQLAGLEQALKTGVIKRLAIANPDHAPYGHRAMQALKNSGLWAVAQPALVLGENVSQAASFVATGNAQAGLIAWSLVAAPPLSQDGHFVLVAETLHDPLIQSMILMKKAQAPARAFFGYLQQDRSKAIFARYGFK